MRALLLAASWAWMLPGCIVARFPAAYPAPDFVSQPRSHRSFRIESDPTLARGSAEICARAGLGDICVRGVRAQLETGVADALDVIAVQREPDAASDYVARIDDIELAASEGRDGFAMRLRWEFSLVEAASGRVVVHASDVESATAIPQRQLASAFQDLEHRVVGDIEEAVARSELVR